MNEPRSVSEEKRGLELPTYQEYDAMRLVREAARRLKGEGERVIYRDAFRWKNDADNAVLSNHYEMFSLKGLAAEFGFEVIHDFNHVAVVKPSELLLPYKRSPNETTAYAVTWQRSSDRRTPAHDGA